MPITTLYDKAPRITVRDPLADFLGATDDGLLTYRYLDAVRLTGHSCPTVASAFLMTRAALAALYPDSVPERGALHAELSAARTDGVCGVVASVVTLLTGATDEGGFKGIGGRFDRRQSLHFGTGAADTLQLRRTDTGAAVGVSARLDRVPAAPDGSALMQRALSPTASPAEQAAFRRSWQDRVRRLLLEHADDPAVFVVRLLDQPA